MASRSALARRAVDHRTAREAQPEQAGDLVEGLARGVVDGRAERLERLRDVVDAQDARVPAGDEHRDGRLGQRPVLEHVDGDVRGQVVDAVQRARRARGRTPWPPRRRRAARRPGPGPLVTATASRSARRTPAVSSARRTVGTIASRCAREATSGTTPPKRACSSTLLATASASSVVPRTTPDAGLVAGGLDPEDQRLVAHAGQPTERRPDAARPPRRPARPGERAAADGTPEVDGRTSSPCPDRRESGPGPCQDRRVSTSASTPPA